MILVVPVLAIAVMLSLPLFFSEGERHWARRPAAVLRVSVIAVVLGILRILAPLRLGARSWMPSPARRSRLTISMTERHCNVKEPCSCRTNSAATAMNLPVQAVNAGQPSTPSRRG